MMGIFPATAAERILTSSARDSDSDGVLIMNWISPFLILSRTWGRRPSASLYRSWTGVPVFSISRAVPSVAKRVKPSAW